MNFARDWVLYEYFFCKEEGKLVYYSMSSSPECRSVVRNVRKVLRDMDLADLTHQEVACNGSVCL